MRYIADINPQHTKLLIACTSSLVIFDFETGDIIHNIDTGLPEFDRLCMELRARNLSYSKDK